MENKICSKCKIEKLLENFVKKNNSPDGCGNSCKQCHNERSRKYRIKHRENIKEYYIKNKEKKQSYLKEYYIENGLHQTVVDSYPHMWKLFFVCKKLIEMRTMSAQNIFFSNQSENYCKCSIYSINSQEQYPNWIFRFNGKIQYVV